MIPAVEARLSASRSSLPELLSVLETLRLWVEERDYAGYEPYDLLNSPRLSGLWRTSAVASSAIIQCGKRFAGPRMRRWLGVPPSKNPKALGLFLAGYCDLARNSGVFRDQSAYLRSELKRLRAADETDYAWGYDWNYVSLRGSVLPAFAANSIATVFCAEALLDAADVFGDRESARMADSAAHFCLTRLNVSWETPSEICFSYTPGDRTLIFNNSALVGALFARIGGTSGSADYLAVASRAMNYLSARQRDDGAWVYGSGPMQQWVDGFHTAYNLSALVTCRRHTEDNWFDDAIARGYEFYKRACFTGECVPKYFDKGLYPIDIHACAQAILTFCDFVERDADALAHAIKVARWTIRNMRSPEGVFYYQRHRTWTNRTPYMRWGQAWMFRALARLIATIKKYG